MIATKLLKREDSVRAALLSESENVVQSVAATRSILFSRFLAAADVGDDRAVASLAGRILESLNLTARVTGELLPVAGVNITNLVVSADYIRLRSDLLAALRPFPEAARAVAAVFARTGERAALEMQRSVPRVIDATATEVPADAAL